MENNAYAFFLLGGGGGAIRCIMENLEVASPRRTRWKRLTTSLTPRDPKRIDTRVE